MKSKISITVNEKTLNRVKGLIDGVKINGLSQAIEYLLEKALVDQRIAVIMATTPQQKEHAVDFEERPLLLVNGKTLIEHAVQKLSESNFKDIFIVGGHKLLTKVYAVLGDGSSFGVEIKYEEEEAPSGGLGLKKIKGIVKSSFLLVFCDILFSNFSLEELWKQHLRYRGVATLLLNTMPPLHPHKEIVAKIRGHQIIEVCNFEKKQLFPYFSGVLVAEPDFLDMPERFRDIFPNLATKGLLTGYIESVPYLHLHTIKEAKRLQKGKEKRNRIKVAETSILGTTF